MAKLDLILLLVVSLLVMISVAESKRLTFEFAGKKTSANELECVSGDGAYEGDTCSLVAASYGMTLDHFLDMNPNIICDGIFAGQWLCFTVSHNEKISAKNELLCADFYGAKEGDTCSNVADTFKLSSHDFFAINPNLNCDKFPFVGQWLCVEPV